MNMLLETGLPEEIDGVPIYADFRNMIRFELILQDGALSPAEQTAYGLRQLFDTVPGSMEVSIQRLMWFYLRGKEPDAESASAARHIDRAYDFNEDASCIYAGFYAAYGLNLTTVEFLHWWEFMALLESLPESTLMAQRMQYRTMDLSGITDKKTRAHYAALKKQFALAAPATKHKSVEEIARNNKERIAKRFEAAQRAAQK